MNSNTKSIVIVYDGPELIDEHVKNVTEYVATLLGLSTAPVTYTLDECDIIKSIAHFTLKDRTGSVSEAEHAVVFIGTMFKDTLEKHEDLEFISELSSRVTAECVAGVNSDLRKAVRIIHNNSYSSVRSSYRKKYMITEKLFDLIARIGSRV